MGSLISEQTAVWAKAAAFTRAQMKEEISDVLARVEEAIAAVSEFKHGHHCHCLADLRQAEDRLKTALREIDIQEGAALING